MARYTTAIFDLDGTLLDTLEDLEISTNAALAAHGLPPRNTYEIRRFVGNGIARLIHLAVPGGTPPKLEKSVLECFRDHYAAHCEDHTQPYPGIIEMLGRVRAAKIAIAIVSNKGDFAVQDLVKRHFPGMVDCTIGENETTGIRRKPAPDMVLEVLHRLGCGRQGLVVIGDSEVDIQLAKNAGCDVILCSWGFREREELVRAGASTIVDTADELALALVGSKS